MIIVGYPNPGSIDPESIASSFSVAYGHWQTSELSVCASGREPRSCLSRRSIVPVGDTRLGRKAARLSAGAGFHPHNAHGPADDSAHSPLRSGEI